MYTITARPKVDKIFLKLQKKNPRQLEIIYKKVDEIIQNPGHYKNLRSPLQHWKRVHIDNHFVLAFSVDENTKTVMLEDYDHHDNIYNQ